MLLNELFNSKIPQDVTKDTNSMFSSTANIDDKKVRFIATDDKGDGHWDIEFGILKDDNSIDYTLTQSGSEFKIFAFVRGCIKHVLDTKGSHIETMTIAADNDSRVSLYKRLLSAVKGFTLEFDDTMSDSGGVIVLTKK